MELPETINSLPNEVLTRIFSCIKNPQDQMRAAFASLKWLELMTTVRECEIWKPVELDIFLDDRCSPNVDYRSDRDAQIYLCQCADHYRNHLRLLERFIDHVGNQLSALLIEDSMVARNAEVSGLWFAS
ncbi:hypothetical protein L596_018294 [Steinernema carpocapsae]|uniref:F-box domain-containing protein n=1 Tax=Steinernema carpocapsae TaxID=34508 RepID=A0A4U5N490_STECR|nr:hypothetical protein L596_018294 [Steinernema carpocapsae]